MFRYVPMIAAAMLAGSVPSVATSRITPTATRVTPVADSAVRAKIALPMTVGGRTRRDRAWIERQWPGTYFETAFDGRGVDFRVGPGEVSLHVVVDGGQPVPLVRPASGYYRLEGLAAGTHRVRVEVVSESQAGPTGFGGFFPLAGTSAAPLPRRARRIEFIGDSHTVGYGNSAGKHDCTADEIWRTTDSSRGIAAVTAARYDADYQVNAISGRGIVRNYGSSPGDTLPQAYPKILFAAAAPPADTDWTPQLVVIGLGTNDFSTPLKPGDAWPTRGALQADYEATYAAFVAGLRARYPDAYFLLWATDIAAGEVEAEARKVVDRLHRSGERRVDFVAVHGLAMGGCDYHPDLADDRVIARALAGTIDNHPEIWPAGRPHPRGLNVAPLQGDAPLS